MRPQLFLAAALLLCATAVGARAQNDITVLTQLVQFDNKNGEEKIAVLRVNFDPRVADKTKFTVYVKPNGAVETACPVFKLPVPQTFTVTKPAPHKINLVLKSNNTVTKRQMRCALTYSIVPFGQPANYFGFPEIGVAYELRH